MDYGKIISDVLYKPPNPGAASGGNPQRPNFVSPPGVNSAPVGRPPSASVGPTTGVGGAGGAVAPSANSKTQQAPAFGSSLLGPVSDVQPPNPTPTPTPVPGQDKTDPTDQGRIPAMLSDAAPQSGDNEIVAGGITRAHHRQNQQDAQDREAAIQRAFEEGKPLESLGIQNVHEGGQSQHSDLAAMDFYGPSWDRNHEIDIQNGMWRDIATSDPNGHEWTPIPPNALDGIHKFQGWAQSADGQRWAQANGGSAYRGWLRMQRLQMDIRNGHLVKDRLGNYVDYDPQSGIRRYMDRFGNPVQPPPGYVPPVDPRNPGATQAAMTSPGSGAGSAGSTGSTPAFFGAPIQLATYPNPESLASYPPGTQLETPYGSITISADGKHQTVLNEAGARAYNEAVGKAQTRFGVVPRTGQAGMPELPIEVGAPNFNPFFGWS